MSEIHEIGEVIPRSVFDFLHSDYGELTIRELSNAGVGMESGKRPGADGPKPLDGKTIVVTGILTKYTRDEINALIEQAGGRAASSVSKKTDYVVAGEKAGSKLEKARKLDVPVISEAEFEKLAGG